MEEPNRQIVCRPSAPVLFLVAPNHEQSLADVYLVLTCLKLGEA